MGRVRRLLSQPCASLDGRIVRAHERVGGELLRNRGRHGVVALTQSLCRQRNLYLKGFVIRVNAPGEHVVGCRVLRRRGGWAGGWAGGSVELNDCDIYDRGTVPFRRYGHLGVLYIFLAKTFLG